MDVSLPIDEAHHGAANSYQAIFEKSSVGVLGLTATPTRHDGKPLDFERESFSIGFPDLIELGVVLRPKVVQVLVVKDIFGVSGTLNTMLRIKLPKSSFEWDYADVSPDVERKK